MQFYGQEQQTLLSHCITKYPLGNIEFHTYLYQYFFTIWKCTMGTCGIWGITHSRTFESVQYISPFTTPYAITDCELGFAPHSNFEKHEFINSM